MVIRINCDLCGKVNESLNRTLIENVELNVCSACSKFGKVLEPIKRPSAKEQHKQLIRLHDEKEEKIELLVEDFAEIIKKRRESIGLTQKDFAKKINEKESTVHNIETGAMEPQLSLARKLERILGVRLVEEHEERHENIKKQKGEGFTLGDFIKIKR